MSEHELEVGEWVRIWGQVEPFEGMHPEDVRLRVESHNADEFVVVRRDRVKYNGRHPEWAMTCSALYEHPDKQHALFRCTRTDGHSGDLYSVRGNCGWPDEHTAGYMEDR